MGNFYINFETSVVVYGDADTGRGILIFDAKDLEADWVDINYAVVYTNEPKDVMNSLKVVEVEIDG